MSRNKISSATFKTILGKFLISSSSKGIRSLKFLDNFSYPTDFDGTSVMADQAIEQINEYLSGVRTEFDVPIDLELPAFYQKVLLTVRKIRFGTINSYKQVAIICDNKKAYRAVGNANSLNPIPIIIPCHRVVPSNGSIGRYAYGEQIKKILLEHEGHSINDNLFFN